MAAGTFRESVCVGCRYAVECDPPQEAYLRCAWPFPQAMPYYVPRYLTEAAFMRTRWEWEGRPPTVCPVREPRTGAEQAMVVAEGTEGAAAEGAAEEARTKAFDEVIAYCRDRAAGLRAEAREAGCEMAAELLLRADECAFLARAFRAVLDRV